MSDYTGCVGEGGGSTYLNVKMAQGTLNHSFEEVTVLLGLSNTFPSLDRSNSSVRAMVTGFFASMSAVEATNITQNCEPGWKEHGYAQQREQKR